MKQNDTAFCQRSTKIGVKVPKTYRYHLMGSTFFEVSRKVVVLLEKQDGRHKLIIFDDILITVKQVKKEYMFVNKKVRQ